MTLLSRCCVVLVRPQGPVNVGLVARACANLGIQDLRLVAPRCGIDVPDARRFANHARDLLLAAPIHQDLDQALADCGLAIGTSAREREDEFGPALLPADLPRLFAERPAERVALVFGNEADGLDADELRRCQARLHLETPGSYPSYNLSHAVAITLYLLHELDAGVAPAGAVQAPPAAATRAEVEALFNYWMGTLERFRYFRRTPRERWAPQFRLLMNRLPLGSHDVDVLRGMLAQFNYAAFGDKAEEMARSGHAPEVRPDVTPDGPERPPSQA